MAGEGHDPDDRITAAIRDLAGDDRRLDAPPPELWGRIAGALDATDDVTSEPVAPPSDLWERIATEVRDAGGRPDARDERSLADEAPAAPRRARRRPLIAALTAAAVLVLVGAVVAVAVARDTTGPTAEVVARASLTGEGLDPGGPGTGSARLLRDDGVWEVTIRAADLPAPATGTYYEAWLLGSGPDDVQSLGALDGAGGFAVPGELDLEDFPLVDVSIEPIDGNPAHSSKSVLRGRLEPA